MLNPDFVSAYGTLKLSEGPDSNNIKDRLNYICTQNTETDDDRDELIKLVTIELKKYIVRDYLLGDFVLQAAKTINPSIKLIPELSNQVHEFGIAFLRRMVKELDSARAMFEEDREIAITHDVITLRRLFEWLIELDLRGLREKRHTDEICGIYFDYAQGWSELIMDDFDEETSEHSIEILHDRLISRVRFHTNDSHDMITNTGEYGDGINLGVDNHKPQFDEDDEKYCSTPLLTFTVIGLDGDVLEERLRLIKQCPLLSYANTLNFLTLYPFIN